MKSSLYKFLFLTIMEDAIEQLDNDDYNEKEIYDIYYYNAHFLIGPESADFIGDLSSILKKLV